MAELLVGVGAGLACIAIGVLAFVAAGLAHSRDVEAQAHRRALTEHFAAATQDRAEQHAFILSMVDATRTDREQLLRAVIASNAGDYERMLRVDHAPEIVAAQLEAMVAREGRQSRIDRDPITGEMMTPVGL